MNVSGKKPKLFFVSSQSTTSTLSTTTLCYSTVAAGTISQSCARKKRTIKDEVLGVHHQPSHLIEAEATHDMEEIVSGMDEATSAERSVIYTDVRTNDDCVQARKVPAVLADHHHHQHPDLIHRHHHLVGLLHPLWHQPVRIKVENCFP